MAVEPLDFSLAKKTGDRLGVYPIPLVRRTAAAFIGRAERGPLNEPVQIEDFEQFRSIFGNHCGFSFLSHCVQHYFMHGGQAAVIVRVANQATRACLDLPADGELLHLQARHPGAHEFLRVSVDYDRVRDDPQRFNLVIQRLRGPSSTLIADQEIYTGVSMRESDRRFVVDALQDSKLVLLSGPLPHGRPQATVAQFPGQPIPYVALTRTGTDGDELTDYDVIGSNREGTGLFALDRAGIDLLCIPAAPQTDLGTTAFLAAERFCENHRAILVCDPPWSWLTAHTAVIGMRTSSRVSRNAMTYFPRIRPRGESGRFPAGIPACGAIAGLLARQDSSGIWAATPTGQLKSSLTPTVTLGEGDATLLGRFGINALVSTDGGNAGLVGDVTLGGASGLSNFWRRLDRRRLFFFVLKSIEEATRWVSDHLDSDTTLSQLDRQVRTFLHGLFEQGALAGAAPGQAFFVQTKGSVPLRAGLVLRLGFALNVPHEFLVYEICYRPEGLSARQIPSLAAEQLLL